jgi:hypothetical protein
MATALYLKYRFDSTLGAEPTLSAKPRDWLWVGPTSSLKPSPYVLYHLGDPERPIKDL